MWMKLRRQFTYESYIVYDKYKVTGRIICTWAYGTV